MIGKTGSNPLGGLARARIDLQRLKSKLRSPLAGSMSIITVAMAVRLVLQVVVFLAIFSCVLANMVVATRLTFALSRDRMLPGSSVLGAVNTTTRTPIASILLVAAVGIGINMLSAGIAAVCTAAFLVATLSIQQWFVAASLAMLLGALLGFLCFNFAPATIFMGDSGSLLIGLLLGVLTTLTTFLPKDRSWGAGWYAVFAPRRTPKEIIAKLNFAVRHALADQTVRWRELGRQRRRDQMIGRVSSRDFLIIRNFGSSLRFGTGGGNVDERQLIAQPASVAGFWWLPWWPAGNVQRTPFQSSLRQSSK